MEKVEWPEHIPTITGWPARVCLEAGWKESRPYGLLGSPSRWTLLWIMLLTGSPLAPLSR